MYIFSILLLAVSSNLDNLILGITYGIKKIHISMASNLIIALITFGGTWLSMLFGEKLAVYVPLAVSNTIGAGVVIIIGIYNLVKYLQGAKGGQTKGQWPMKKPERYDKNSNNQIEYQEAAALGAALSINNIALGIAASISGVNAMPTAVAAFCCSIIFICMGNMLGSGLLSKTVGRFAEPIGALGIIALGICELLF